MDVQEKMKKKDKILTETVSSLFNTISAEDVLFRNKDGVWILGERKIDEGQFRQYAEEAEIILKFGVWREAVRCMKYLSNRKMFFESQTTDDLLAGKLLLYFLQELENILKKAESLKK